MSGQNKTHHDMLTRTPYKASSDRAKRARVAALKDFARKLSADERDAMCLISDAAGACNKTTSSISEYVASLMPPGTARAPGESRDKALSLMSHVSNSGTHGEAKMAGLDVGWRIWAESQKGPKKNKGNRPGAGAPARAPVRDIMEEWSKAADFGGKVSQSYNHIARSIGQKLSVNARCVLRWKPSAVAKVSGANDLCSACELLKRRRMQVLGLDDKGTEGARAVRAVWQGAKYPGCIPSDMETLGKHESLVDLLKATLEADKTWSKKKGNRLCIFDYAAPATLRAPRATDKHFHGKKSIIYFGGLVFDGSGVTYHHVFDLQRGAKHASAHALQCCNIIFRSKSFLGEDRKLSLLRIRSWSDTATTFRSREFIGGMLSLGAYSMRVSFHAEGHGKTQLDAIFGAAKEALSQVDALRAEGAKDFQARVAERFSTFGEDGGHCVHFFNMRAAPNPVQLTPPAGIFLRTPHIWQTRRHGGAMRLDYDWHGKWAHLATTPCTNEPIEHAEDAVDELQEQETPADTILPKLGKKFSRSQLLQNCAGGKEASAQ